MRKPTQKNSSTDQSEQEYLQEHEMSRRDFMLDSLALGGLAAAFGMSASTAAWGNVQPPADEVVRIGYLPITDATVLLVAHAKGFFEEEGLKTERPTLIRGWSPLVEGFAAGKFNLVHFLKPIPIWMRYNNNFPVKIMSWAHLNGSGLVVGRHTDAKSFSDLGGKQVAVPYWYSMHNIVLQMGLRHAGLTPVIKSQGDPIAANEVNLQIMPPPDMPPALAARKIDAFIVAEPFNAVGEMLAGGKMLRFTGDIWRNHPCCVVCMNENQVNANPTWTQKVMNAIVKAQIYSQQNKKEVAHLLSKDGEGYLPMDANIVEQAMTLYDEESYADPEAIQNAEWGSGRIDFQPWPFPSATKLIINELKRTLVGGDTTFLQNLDPDFVVNDLVDYKFVKAAMDKHPGWKQAPGFNADNPFDREEVVKL
ncbi:MAG: ABC transporter substrate-binding protein [Alteromonadaceae bacterium]|jgi:NitT/TauT family transport system substrate-binding protein|nr:ABC transporter substrate-binding protein [Alteromonadaceae bacterium]MCP4061897.1 ABC transporter substrate-binding protein [Gammaproteobacteria bacterium]|tara:strand:- start:8270 stop:9532 length:1263 start_codon:yes stop_codon:yes gene_type:complete